MANPNINLHKKVDLHKAMAISSRTRRLMTKATPYSGVIFGIGAFLVGWNLSYAPALGFWLGILGLAMVLFGNAVATWHTATRAIIDLIFEGNK